MCITTIFAVYPALAEEQLIKVLKIQLMIFVAMMLITNKERLNWLVLTIALSIGFYGFKGGIFTIVHGGVYRVQGPAGTFIAGNNELGLGDGDDGAVALLLCTASSSPLAASMRFTRRWYLPRWPRSGRSRAARCWGWPRWA